VRPLLGVIVICASGFRATLLRGLYGAVRLSRKPRSLLSIFLMRSIEVVRTPKRRRDSSLRLSGRSGESFSIRKLEGTVVWCLATGAFAFTTSLVPGVAQTLTGNEAAASLGRRDARVITTFREPTVCAPVALVPQCEYDLDSFAGSAMDREDSQIPNAGPFPFRVLRAAIAGGDLVHASRALSYINSRSYPNLPQPQRAIASTAEAAGLIRSAGANRLLQALSLGPLLAPQNQAQLTALGLTSPNPTAMLTGTGDGATEPFVQAVDAKFPPIPILALPAPDGQHDEIVLGIAISTLRELFELPTLARFAEMHPFIDEALSRIHERAPAVDAEIATVRTSLGTTDAKSAEVALAAFNRLHSGLSATFVYAGPATRRLAIGETVAQLGYNAAVFRDPGFGAAVRLIPQLRSALPADDVLQVTLALLAACDPNDFACQRKAAAAFVARALHSTPH
jgi:hypothetical protein